MEKLSINIVHTALDNFKLSQNARLLSQIGELGLYGNSDLEINILVNGNKTINSEHFDYVMRAITTNNDADFIEGDYWRIYEQPSGCNIRFIYNSGDILPLGSARDALVQSMGGGFNYYINVDEDDDLVSYDCVLELQSKLHLMQNPIALFAFNWIFERDGELIINRSPDRYPDAKVFDKDNEESVIMEGLRGLCSWNIVHNKADYIERDLVRPAINKYDDCFFYSQLVHEYPYVDFIDVPVYNYHQERGRMNTEKDSYLNTVTDYISRKPFIVNNIIR